MDTNINTILFYILVIAVIYVVFFHKSIEKFKNDVTRSKKACSQDSINVGILDYVFGGLYSR